MRQPRKPASGRSSTPWFVQVGKLLLLAVFVRIVFFSWDPLPLGCDNEVKEMKLDQLLEEKTRLRDNSQAKVDSLLAEMHQHMAALVVKDHDDKPLPTFEWDQVHRQQQELVEIENEIKQDQSLGGEGNTDIDVDEAEASVDNSVGESEQATEQDLKDTVVEAPQQDSVFVKREFVPDIHLPSLNKPFVEGEMGFCRHWRAGNRSRVLLSELESHSPPDKTYMWWHGSDSLDNRMNSQSRFFCRAAVKAGWRSTFNHTTWKPSEKNFKLGLQRKTAIFCGGDLWGGWNKGAQTALEASEIPHIQKRSTSPLRYLSKIQMFRRIRDASAKLGCNYAEQGFHSLSFDFSNRTDCARFFDEARNNPEYRSATWITKTNKHQSKGVRFLKYNQVEKEYAKCDHSHPFLLQRLMEDLLMLDNRKWDARVYVLVPSTKPLIVYAFDIFHVRASLEASSISDISAKSKLTAKDMDALVTNYVRQVKSIGDDNYKEHNMPPETLVQHAANAGVENPDLFLDTIFRKMQAVLEFVFHTVDEWPGKAGEFRLYAFDFLVNKNLQPSLIDINYSPGMLFRKGFWRQLTDTIFEEALSIVHEVQAGQALGVEREPHTNHFHLTYHQDKHAKSFWNESPP